MRSCSWRRMAAWAPMMFWGKAMADCYDWTQKRSCSTPYRSSSRCGPKSSKAEYCTTPSTLSEDMVDTAVQAGFFNSLVEAVKAAGLVETLKSEGPFTLFAPTDEAFAKIPSKDLNALLKNPEKLKSVLTYHVVSGNYPASALAGVDSLKTVQGNPLKIDTTVGVKVDSSYVIKSDVRVRNGVIHVIDSVLMPDFD